MNIVKSGDTRRGGDRKMLIELLRSLQLSRKKRKGGFTGLAHNSCQSTLHRSQWKFIFPIGYISFRIRLDSMLKLIWNYINPNGFAVQGLEKVLSPCSLNVPLLCAPVSVQSCMEYRNTEPC